MKSQALYAQAAAPYSIAPKWYFGLKAGMDFTSGLTSMNGNPLKDADQENATTMVDSARNVLFYSNSNYIINGLNVNLQQVNGGNSSTGGCISIPDPTDPANKFYLIIANVDPTSSSRHDTSRFSPALGMWYYSITKTGIGTIIINNPSGTSMPGGASVTNNAGESLSASHDGSGGYWVITHDGNSSNLSFPITKYWIWHFTSSGTITGPVKINGVTPSLTWQQSIKFNKCQNKIGFVNQDGNYEVYNWTKATGTLGSLICSGYITDAASLYGCEFSPDGNKFYVSELDGSNLWQIDLSSGTCEASVPFGTNSSNSVDAYGALQLGPDDKIYVINASDTTNTGNKYIGVISNPNNAITGTTTAQAALDIGYSDTGFLLAAGSEFPNFNQGLVNEVFMPPFLEINVSSVSPCIKLSYKFKQYYGKSVNVKYGSEDWDYGDGTGWHNSAGSSPSVSYTTDNFYTIKLRLKDSVCAQTWTMQKVIPVTCNSSLPVNFISVEAKTSESHVAIEWSTSNETNNNFFEIQRSVDGVTFSAIGTVKGKAETQPINQYLFEDLSPMPGINYYRLVQIDYDQKKTFSSIVSVTMDDFLINVFPNPSNGEFNLRLDGIGNTTIIIQNVVGKEIYKTTIDESVSTFVFGKDFIQGTYLLKVIANQKIKSIGIVKY